MHYLLSCAKQRRAQERNKIYYLQPFDGEGGNHEIGYYDKMDEKVDPDDRYLVLLLHLLS